MEIKKSETHYIYPPITHRATLLPSARLRPRPYDIPTPTTLMQTWVGCLFQPGPDDREKNARRVTMQVKEDIMCCYCPSFPFASLPLL